MIDEALKTALEDTRHILFLCSGNMVRSAFADLYAQSLGCPLPVSSAATTYRNDGLYPETVRALRRFDVAEQLIRSFRPTHLDDVVEQIGHDHLVLGMTRAHLHDFADALGRATERRVRAFRLSLAVGHDVDIADPVLDDVDFGATFERVARCVEALVADLRHSQRELP